MHARETRDQGRASGDDELGTGEDGGLELAEKRELGPRGEGRLGFVEEVEVIGDDARLEDAQESFAVRDGLEVTVAMGELRLLPEQITAVNLQEFCRPYAVEDKEEYRRDSKMTSSRYKAADAAGRSLTSALKSAWVPKNSSDPGRDRRRARARGYEGTRPD